MRALQLRQSRLQPLPFKARSPARCLRLPRLRVAASGDDKDEGPTLTTEKKSARVQELESSLKKMV